MVLEKKSKAGMPEPVLYLYLFSGAGADSVCASVVCQRRRRRAEDGAVYPAGEVYAGSLPENYCGRAFPEMADEFGGAERWNDGGRNGYECALGLCFFEVPVCGEAGIHADASAVECIPADFVNVCDFPAVPADEPAGFSCGADFRLRGKHVYFQYLEYERLF